jgi:hypothetical protein
MIPFKTRHTRVTASGFVRDRPTLAKRLVAYLDQKQRYVESARQRAFDDSISFGQNQSVDSPAPSPTRLKQGDFESHHRSHHVEISRDLDSPRGGQIAIR